LPSCKLGLPLHNFSRHNKMQAIPSSFSKLHNSLLLDFTLSIVHVFNHLNHQSLYYMRLFSCIMITLISIIFYVIQNLVVLAFQKFNQLIRFKMSFRAMCKIVVHIIKETFDTSFKVAMIRFMQCVMQYTSLKHKTCFCMSCVVTLVFKL
jgi:hypothetical protein